MNLISASNPRYTLTGIELEVDFDDLGLVPYHAVPTDPEDSLSYSLYQRAINKEFGDIAPYVANTQIAPQIITARQGKLTLLDYGIYQNVIDYIASIPGEAGIRAKISWEAATEFNRNDPVLAAITQALSLTSEEIDQMFIHGANL